MIGETAPVGYLLIDKDLSTLLCHRLLVVNTVVSVCPKIQAAANKVISGAD